MQRASFFRVLYSAGLSGLKSHYVLFAKLSHLFEYISNHQLVDYSCLSKNIFKALRTAAFLKLWDMSRCRWGVDNQLKNTNGRKINKTVGKPEGTANLGPFLFLMTDKTCSMCCVNLDELAMMMQS